MTCSHQLRAQNRPYPRTCTDCGLGPCKETRSLSVLSAWKTECIRLVDCYSDYVSPSTSSDTEDAAAALEALIDHIEKLGL